MMQKNARRGLTSVCRFYLDATAIVSKLGAAAAVLEGVDGLLNEMRPEAPRWLPRVPLAAKVLKGARLSLLSLKGRLPTETPSVY